MRLFVPSNPTNERISRIGLYLLGGLSICALGALYVARLNGERGTIVRRMRAHRQERQIKLLEAKAASEAVRKEIPPA